jgi:hypothetical protein
MPIKAETISQIQNFKKIPNTDKQTARIEFDLSSRDFSKIDRINLDLSAVLQTQLLLTNVTYAGDYVVNPGKYSSKMVYGLGVTVNGKVLQSELQDISDSVIFSILAGEKTTLGTGNSFKTVSHTDSSFNWSSQVDLLPLVNSNSILTIDFTLRGPGANIIDPFIPDGMTSGITSNAISGAMVSLELTPSESAVPEPASMLIFGLAGAVGISLVNRLRRKK